MVYYVLCMQMRGRLYTFSLNGSIKSHYVYLRYVWQLSPPSYGPNRPRHNVMQCPATKKW